MTTRAIGAQCLVVHIGVARYAFILPFGIAELQCFMAHFTVNLSMLTIELKFCSLIMIESNGFGIYFPIIDGMAFGTIDL
jgi:hypothetical protein